MKLLTAEQMRKIDRATIEKFGIAAIVLMENAGRSVAEAVRHIAADYPSARIVVIAGKGNNGGDGFVAARHLCNSGFDVGVILLGAREEITGHAAANFDMIENMGVPIKQNPDEKALSVRAAQADIIVDAILGTGLSGDVRGLAERAIEAINAADARVVAVDIPSGIHADTGRVLGTAVNADVTVTFAAMKIGHTQYPGAAHCGDITVADITIPRALLASDSLNTSLIDEQMATQALPQRRPSMHKGDAGRVLVVAGSVGMTGAATLCALAAVRAGAGLVYAACPESINDILETKCTEALTIPLPETDQRSIAAEAATEILERAEGADAVAIGPGLSQTDGTVQFVCETVGRIGAPVVLDADGLNCLQGHLDILADRDAPTVMTPHPGELARLLDSTVGEVQADRVGTARRAADKMQVIVVLKGAGTVIAIPDGRAWVNPTGNSGMASGGTGDVLPGMIAAFIAGGAEPVDAAIAGVYYHGLAGDAAAADGRRGLAAGDLPDRVRDVLPD